MDLLLAFVAGIALMALVSWIVRKVRRSSKDSNDKSASAGESFEQRKQREKEDRETALYDELYDRYHSSSTRVEYETLERDVRSNQSKLSVERYNRLINLITDMLGRLADEERRQAEMEPKLAKFRALKNSMDTDNVFTELHRINVLDAEDSIISYGNLESYGETADVNWMYSTYDRLVLERFRILITIARSGTVTDYRNVRTLFDELEENDYTNENHEDIEEILAEHLKDEWNEMIVRFVREPDSDDLFGYDDLTEDDYKEIVRKAREEGDLLSLSWIILLDDDGEIADTLVEVLMTEFRTELEKQHLALGFKSGEDARSV